LTRAARRSTGWTRNNMETFSIRVFSFIKGLVTLVLDEIIL